MSTPQLAEIVDDLDFNRAFRRVKHDSQYDFIQFPIELKLYEAFFNENIKSLKELIKQGSYTPQRLRKIWVPKKNYFVRPGAIPHLEDRILFQALVDNVARKLEQQLPPLQEEVVFSSRLNPNGESESLFVHPRQLWLAFKRKAIEYCDDENTKYALISDISSYFENIDLRLLTDTLTSSGVSPNYADAIRYILVVWANGRTRGVPQMMAPCSLLANMYLSQVDKNMVLRGYRYIRYVDDIRIFVSSATEAKKTLLVLTDRLKDCYLDVQASKTKIVHALEHKQELMTLETHLTESGIETDEEDTTTDYEDHSEPQSHIPEDKLIRFLESLVGNPNYDDRHLRFCINNLSRIGSPAALDLVLSRLISMPQETETFVRYLFKLPPSVMGDKVFDIVTRFLDSENNIYDWQMMWLLIFLAKQPIGRNHLNQLYRNEKLYKHSINRALLNYILCSKGDFTIQREMMSKYGQEESIEARIGILCGLYNLEKKERNRFYSIAGTERILNQLIETLRGKSLEFI